MSDIILDTSISTKDETDNLSYDEWDGLLISEWFEADPGAPVPASSREDEFKFCYQNPDAWKFVTLPKGMNRETAIQILQNEARFQVLFGEARTGNPHHDNLGRFSSGSGGAGIKGDVSVSDKKASNLAERVQEPDGGFTVNPRNGKDVNTGFAVAIYPERSKEIPHEIVNKDTIHQYVSDNKDLLRQDGNMVGGWHDPDSGNVWLDVSRVTGNKQEAIDLAKQHNQIAIFDLGSGNSINTGGTGRSSYPFVFTRANPYHDKEGKFASKNGKGTGSYNPGAWKEVPKNSVPLAPNALYVAKNGGATYVESQPVSPEKRKKILATLDDLHTRFPPKSDVPTTVFIDNIDDGSYGMTVRGKPVMMIDAVRAKDVGETGEFMPSAFMHKDGIQYVIAHEWGHVIDTRSSDDVVEHDIVKVNGVWKQIDGMSSYGKTDPREGFAEAFADFYITDGKSNNPATKAYVEEEGWQ